MYPFRDAVEETTSILGSDVSLSNIARCIRDRKINKVVVLAGAGISVAAGIPDFRTPGTGLYDNLEKYDLPRPEAVFDIDFFCSNPKPFFTLAKELWPGKFIPTKTHYFIRLLQEKGILHRVYTQNIDTLERVAGIPEDKLVEAHGSFHKSKCIRCGKEYSKDFVKDHVLRSVIPQCTDCTGIIKPCITFFGENLPLRFGKLAQNDMRQADLLLVMGTSLKVHPVASLPGMVSHKCPRVLFNREKVAVPPPMDPRFKGNETLEKFYRERMVAEGLFLFDDEANYRDVFVQGDADDGVLEFAEGLGWAEDLEALEAGERKRLVADGFGAPAPVADADTSESKGVVDDGSVLVDAKSSEVGEVSKEKGLESTGVGKHETDSVTEKPSGESEAKSSPPVDYSAMLKDGDIDILGDAMESLEIDPREALKGKGHVGAVTTDGFSAPSLRDGARGILGTAKGKALDEAAYSLERAPEPPASKSVSTGTDPMPVDLTSGDITDKDDDERGSLSGGGGGGGSGGAARHSIAVGD